VKNENHFVKRNRPSLLMTAPSQNAVACIGELQAGVRIFGFTKGQFSLLDLIWAVLNQTGPAHVVVSTWTTGIRDAENSEMLLKSKQILTFQLVTDRSFPTRQPQYCQRLIEIFGSDSIRCTRTHAKFALIRNESWNIAIRSSMNLNKNARFEQFDLDDDREMCDFIQVHVQELIENMSQGFDFSTAQCDAVFIDAGKGNLSQEILPNKPAKKITSCLANKLVKQISRETRNG
jgi:hypothetical protein